jgi:hypothetical protein
VIRKIPFLESSFSLVLLWWISVFYHQWFLAHFSFVPLFYSFLSLFSWLKSYIGESESIILGFKTDLRNFSTLWKHGIELTFLNLN